MRSFFKVTLSLAVFVAPVAFAQGDDVTAPTNAAQKGAAELKRPVVVGSLSKQQIEQTIKMNQPSVKACYDQALQKQPASAGKVAVTFIIDGTGTVTEANVANDTVKNEQMASCIVTAMKTWKFPEPKGGGKVTVTYPWVFQPKHAAK